LALDTVVYAAILARIIDQDHVGCTFHTAVRGETEKTRRKGALYTLI
jgi:hypothetical protein